jgi:hypothetical protein
VLADRSTRADRNLLADDPVPQAVMDAMDELDLGQLREIVAYCPGAARPESSSG